MTESFQSDDCLEPDQSDLAVNDHESRDVENNDQRDAKTQNGSFNEHTSSQCYDRVAIPTRKPGPGFWEAILWTVGVLIVHMFAGIFMLFAVFLTSATNKNELLAVLTNPARLKEFVDAHMLMITGGEMGLFVVVVLAATFARLGRETIPRLNLTPISRFHLVLIFCSFLPLSLFCGQLHLWSTAVWNHIVEMIPILQLFDSADTMESIKPLAESASLPTLFVIIGLAPAISEELIFRGVIGRGLVARFGVVGGIALTSIFFAIVHLHPAHAFALLPLAVLIHLSYIATKSFWAPVLIHLLNNSSAAIVLKQSLKNGDIEQMAGETELPLILGISAGIACVFTGIMLWKTRMQWKIPDGTIWSPGYETVEVPELGPNAVQERRTISSTTFFIAALGIAQFLGALAVHAATVGEAVAK